VRAAVFDRPGAPLRRYCRAGQENLFDRARFTGLDIDGGFAERTVADELDAALIFAPVGALVPRALRAVRKGGTVVCGGIHMSDIPAFPYADLWGERVLRSVANLTRAGAEAFLALAPRVPVRTTVTAYPLDATQDALDDLRAGRLTGAAVIDVQLGAARGALEDGPV
jgi:propanol-preferring alcohol dehydrogenase